jgi:tripartite-type tricarboxylate transporter receptor subunit TctC
MKWPRTGEFPAALFIVMGVLAFAAESVHADNFPARPIRVVVPYPPGNLADVTARILSDPLSKRLGQPIVIENKAGATGVIGVDFVVQAPPDGYTLLLNSISIAIGPAVLKKVPYDVARDLVPIALIGWTSMMMVANLEFPADDVAGVVALLRAAPGTYSYAHFGVGSLSQISMESFKRAAGLDIVGVPYRGAGPALTDVLGGRVPLMFDAMTSAFAQVQAGKVKPIAVSAAHRSRFAPNVPTLAESGMTALRDYNVEAWSALFAPAGTPAPIVAQLNAAALEAMRDPDFLQHAAAQTLEAYPAKSPAEASAFVRDELSRWRKIVRDVGLEGTQ